MKMFGKVLFICATCLIVSHAIETPKLDSDTVMKSKSFVWQIFNTGKKLKNTFSCGFHTTLDHLYLSLTYNINQITKNLHNFVNKRKDVAAVRLGIYKFHKAFKKIDNRYKEFRTVTDPKRKFDTRTKRDFAAKAVDKNGIEQIYRDYYQKLFGDNLSLISLLNSTYEELHSFCQTSKTRQRFFYDLFLSIVAQEYKIYTMMRDSHHFYSNSLNYTDIDYRIKQLNTNTDKRLAQIIKFFKPIIAFSSRTMRRCDLRKRHVEGKTYTYLKNLFTSVFQHSSEIKQEQYNYFTSECPIDSNNILEVKCDGECQIPQRKCHNLVQCSYAPKSHLCLEKDQSKTRRYSYVRDNNSSSNKLMSKIKKTSCEKEYFIQDPSPYSSTNFCNCICDESDQSDRYFSLDSIKSRVEENYVVTGVKFVKINGIVSLQIQQGQLRPFGFINQKTVKWTSTKPHKKHLVERPNKIDENVSNNDSEMLSDDQGHYNITWTKSRGIFLSNIESPKGHVVTGIRFSTDHIGEEKFLTIEIESTKVNFITGKLNTRKSLWHSTRAKDFQDNLIKINKADAPTNVNLSHEPDLVENQIIRFAPTSSLSKDTGSSVIPYLDIQPLYSSDAVPLSSMGLDYMGAKNSGGYLALKAKSFDVSPHLA